MHQERYCLKINPLSKDCSFKDYRSRRQELAWLHHTRPNISSAVNLLTQVTEAMVVREHVNKLNIFVKRAQLSPRRGIRQQRLELSTLSLKV